MSYNLACKVTGSELEVMKLLWRVVAALVNSDGLSQGDLDELRQMFKVEE